MTYDILCEDCAKVLGTWTPQGGTTPSEDQIIKSTRKGYLCSDCADNRLQGDEAIEP